MFAVRRWIRGLNATEIAALGLFVTVTIAVIYFLQLLAMQRTVTMMEKQTRLSVRPWVGLDEGLDSITASPLKIDADGNASIVYNIRTKNYSSVPATNVSASANLVVADDLNTVYEQQDNACSEAMVGKPDIGLLLFQGRDRVFESVPSFTKVSQKHQGGQVQAWLAGCVGYRDQFGYLCRTKFMWMMYETSGYVSRIDAYKWPVMINGQFRPTGGGIDTCQIPKYNYGEGPYAKKPN